MRGGFGEGRATELSPLSCHPNARSSLANPPQGCIRTVGGGYCRLQMPLKLALAARETVAGHRLAPWKGGRGYIPLFHPWGWP